MPKDSSDYVTASELAEFVYCECCWADNLEGLKEETLAMQEGTAGHNALFSLLSRLNLLTRIAIVLIVLGIALLLLFVLLRSILTL